MTGSGATSVTATTATTGSAGTDQLTVTFDLRAPTPAEALRSAGTAAGMLAELLTDTAAAVDLSGVAVVVRAQ
jgi:hypothetical protein